MTRTTTGKTVAGVQGARARQQSKKQRKKEARAGLLKFQAQLEKGCDALDTPEKWYARIKKLKELVEQYTEVLPEKSKVTLDQAIHDADAVEAGFDQACKVLKNDLLKSARLRYFFSLGEWVGIAASAAVIATAAAAGTLALLTHLQPAARLEIHNVNCGTIPSPGQSAWLDLLAVEAPEGPIPNGGTGEVTLPAITMSIDGRAKTSLTIGMLGVSQTIPLAGRLSEGRLNDQSFVEQALRVDLAPTNTLEITCG